MDDRLYGHAHEPSAKQRKKPSLRPVRTEEAGTHIVLSEVVLQFYSVMVFDFLVFLTTTNFYF